MSQFAFLQPEFASVFATARKAEINALSDPRVACFYARFALETAVKWMYDHDRALKSPYTNDLAAWIAEPTFKKLAGPDLTTKADNVRRAGNRAVHDNRTVSPQDTIAAIRELFHFSYWLVRTYAKGAKPAPGLQFLPDALPKTARVEETTLARLQAIAKEMAEAAKAREAADAARIQTEQQYAELQAQNEALKAEIAATKAANQATPDTHDYDEAATRDTFIDLLLHEAGWPLDQERDREFPITGMPNAKGQGFVDYVLWGDDGKPLAVVEAKRTRRDARVGQQQAKLYADCLERQFGQRPVIFYTNGYEHWLWDDLAYPPRAVQGFLKKDELMLLLQRRTSRKSLSSIEIDPRIAGRYYQTRAIRRIDETFERDHQRKALLVMATGSGKTRTAIALVDQLMRANWAKRILFLADRVALVNQAARAFKTHMPHAAPVNLVTDKSTEGRIYVSTYPTMMGLIDEMQNGVRRFGTGHFDLIIIDEAHRSIYRKYRAIFDYFDCLLVGLTATPRDEIDRDTYSLFELERGVPTDSYDLDQAVTDGNLVPARAISVPLKFQREGIKYDNLSDEEKEEWETLDWEEDTDIVPNQVESAAVNKWLFNADTVDKVLEHLMTNGLKVEEGDRLGKTIVFAKNHAHAQFIAERFDANYPHLKGHFARVIDFATEYPQSLIDDFSAPAKPPHIAISVDMLDTGIDVPEVLNLVFFKIVRSKTKFWQMLGRGTRLCPDLFGPGRNKDHFVVFDFCQNFEFFNQNLPTADGSVAASLSEKLFAARVELIGEIEKTTPEPAVAEIRKDFATHLFDEVSGMSLDNFIIRPKRRYVEKFQKPEAWNTLSSEDRRELVENLAGLPSAVRDDDLAAKQFDHLVLSAELALIKIDAGFTRLQKRIRDIASQLEDLANVPMVAAQIELIQSLMSDEYWQDITLPMLEAIRRRLRGLVKLIEPKSRKFVYTDFEDEIGDGVEVDLPSVGPGGDQARFLMKARHFVKAHADHIAVQKLHRNEQLTAQDLAELERIFTEEGFARVDDLQRIQKDGGLGIFIRSLVGLDREAAKRAFAGFVDGRALTANQIEFVNLIIDDLTQHGIMNPKRLYESPFTDLDDQGVNGLFPAADVIVLLGLLQDVRQKAAA